MTARSRNLRAHGALLIAGFGWSLTPVILRGIGPAYDAFTLTFYRYALALGPLLAMSWCLHRADFVRGLRNPARIAPLAAVVILQQYTWIEGLRGTQAAAAHLIMKLSIVLIIVLSFILFHEERAVIRSPRFLVGAAISLVGVALVLNPGDGSLLPDLDRYSLLVMATALLWAFYVVGGKHAAKDLHPVPMFTVLALYTGVAYALMAAAWGDPALALTLDGRTLAITALVGVLPLAVGHPLFHHAQTELGSSYCSTFNLFTPAITYALALAFLPGETLAMPQLIGAATLIAGTLVISMRGRTVPAGALEPVVAPATAK